MTRFPFLAALSLPLGILLLQHHGIAFWSGALGSPLWGWITSPSLEIFNLWGWAEAARRPRAVKPWLFASLTTALLIAAPLYDVSMPLLAQAERAAVVQERQDQLELNADRLSRLAEKRPGWGRLLGQTFAEQSTLFEEKLQAAETFTPLDWQRRAVIVAHGLALCLAMAAVVAGIRTLSGWWYERGEEGPRLGDHREMGLGLSAVPAAQAGNSRASVEGQLDLSRARTLDLDGDAALHPRAGNGASETETTGKAQEIGENSRTEALRAMSTSSWDWPEALAHPLTARVRAMLAALAVQFPGKADAQIAGEHDPNLARDLSLCRNHPRRVREVAQGNKGVKVITENGLARLERMAQAAQSETGMPNLEARPASPAQPAQSEATPTHVRSL